MSPRSAAPALDAYVLHQYDWSESSLIVELFTRERGRLAVAAKGAKRPTSNFRALLMHFNQLHVQLGKAPADQNAELFNLRSAEWAGGAAFAGAGQALFAAFYVNELLLALLPRQDPHPALFDTYAGLLPLLEADDEGSRRAALRAFEWQLLRELGWLPELGVLTQTRRAVEAARRYGLHPEHGLVVDESRGIGGAALLRVEASTSFASLHDACLEDTEAMQHQLGQLLHYHRGSLPVPWRSVRVQRGAAQLTDVTEDRRR